MLVKPSLLTHRFGKGSAGGAGSKGRRAVRARRRWRVEIVNENTLARTWSIVLSGVRVWVAAAVVVGALVSLISVIFMFTPLGGLLPGHLDGDLRSQYLDAALRIDSLERAARSHEAYADNIRRIFAGEAPDTAGRTVSAPATVADSLLEASEAERRFVRQFDARERFNLSVLSPIAAEGMIFESPVENIAGAGNIDAVYRGTVTGVTRTSGGSYTVTVQHPNDFLSVYSRLDELYVDKGAKVMSGQRIGRTASGNRLDFELWHAGSLLDPQQYVGISNPLTTAN